MANAYYNPEELGLTILGEAGYYSYDYDMFVVWRDAEGKLYWAWDSGCSCYSPFEEHDGLDKLVTGTKHEALKALADWEGTPNKGLPLREKLAAL